MSQSHYNIVPPQPDLGANILRDLFIPLGKSASGLNKFVYKPGTPVQIKVELREAPVTPEQYYQLGMKAQQSPRKIRVAYEKDDDVEFILNMAVKIVRVTLLK